MCKHVVKMLAQKQDIDTVVPRFFFTAGIKGCNLQQQNILWLVTHASPPLSINALKFHFCKTLQVKAVIYSRQID